jgi:hypothetical protein
MQGSRGGGHIALMPLDSLAMAAVTFDTFDPTPYQRAPRGNVQGILALSQALVESRPEGASEAVERMAAKLGVVIAETESGLTARRRESAPADFSQEVELDGFADVMWGALRSGLELWRAFEHPGLATVVQAQKQRSAVAIALRAGQNKAKVARGLAGKLFGSEGLAFTQTTYPEQAVSMATILRLIEEDGLAAEVDTVVAPEILVALTACQPLYEAMVETRMTRTDRKSSDLAVLRTKLQRAISLYCMAVLAMLDESKPETLERVIGALQPIDVYRAQLGSVKKVEASEGGVQAGVGDEESGADEEPEPSV